MLLRTFSLLALLVMAVTALAAADNQAPAQAPRPATQPAAPSPRAAAVFDLTGYWVSVVSEDWRYRMVTPAKGDYGRVPMTAEARKVADTWDVSKDGSCLAYGAAGLLRIPTRLRITWEDDTVLTIETDAGMQARRLLFNKPTSPGPPSLQGVSVASWERGPGGTVERGGTLTVTTTQMAGGWVQKNGVPYSEGAAMTEYFDRFTAPNGDPWFTVTTIVEDPRYFSQPFVTTTHFKKESDPSKWRPAPCRPTTQ